MRLKHSPWPREIAGGITILNHFGSWEKALAAAKLSNPTTPDKLSEFSRIQEETVCTAALESAKGKKKT